MNHFPSKYAVSFQGSIDIYVNGKCLYSVPSEMDTPTTRWSLNVYFHNNNFYRVLLSSCYGKVNAYAFLLCSMEDLGRQMILQQDGL